MATVKAEEFTKDSANGSEQDDPYYFFDSKKALELKRLDEQHHALMELMRDRLVHSPVQQPKRILDICCGTGITTITLARLFPDAQIIGIDINPIPPIHAKPPNVTYIQARIEDIVESINSPSAEYENADANITLGKGSFDLIFARLITLVISNWPTFISACTNLLAPNGWLEFQDPAGYEFYTAASPIVPLQQDPSNTWTWMEGFWTGAAELGYDFLAGKTFHAKFLAEGLNDVRSRHYPWCPYPWTARPETRRMGAHMQEFGTVAAPLMVKAFTGKVYEENRVEWERDIAEAFNPDKGHEGLHWRFYVVCGRKEG